MPDYTTPTYTSPQTSSGGTDAYDWIRLGLAYKQYQDAKKPPKFAETPLSPEQRKLLEMYMGSMSNPALKDNAAKVDSRAEAILGSYSNLGWQSPKTFNGEVGYAGTRSPFAGSPMANPSSIPGPPVQGSSVPPGSGGTQRPGGFMALNRISPVDGGNTIPGARMPENSWSRNVGVQGSTQSFNPTASGTMRPFDANLPGGQMQFGAADISGFTKYLSGLGVKDAAKVVLAFFTGGLVGAAREAVSVLHDRYARPQPTPQTGATLPAGAGTRSP